LPLAFLPAAHSHQAKRAQTNGAIPRAGQSESENYGKDNFQGFASLPTSNLKHKK